ncbi:MAG: DUF1684 domain-containing protein [Pseudomonadota bacterium]|nr:DUF1684 domain-containing protein [Pseudomonadota bacterium]
MSPEAIAFSVQQQVWRDQRRADLVRPDGWTSLIGLHWLDPGSHYVGSDPDNGIRLSMGPPQLGMLELGEEGIRLVPHRDARLLLDGAPIVQAIELQSDEDGATPSRLGFDKGLGVATVIKRGDRHALRVKHADAPTRTGFAGLEYWPADRQWAVDGRFIAHPDGRTMPIANILGFIEPTPNPGIVEFEHGGNTHRIEALAGGDGTLFLVFADRTNGQGSYGAGRFLDTAKPLPDGSVVVDFNQSYNPPCAFTAFATCPLPPPENRLDLIIDAGEKSYAMPAAKRPS